MLPSDGPFVLKGQTNSKKAQWKTHMYATNRVEAMKVYGRLCDDGLIGDQKIYIRQFVPLVSYFDDVAGLPVTKEFRFFVYNGIVLCGAFYWSNYADEVEQKLGKIPSVDEVPFEFLSKIVHRIGTKIPFYALDIAETQSGEWTVIELNDGQMSGLSMNDPKLLYKHLAKLVAPQK
jgi:hypothetical protein